jgi:histidinol-phosphate aminotransferase
MGIESLARPEIVAMKPYSSARKEAPGQGILLNANESPWPLLEDSGLNRYPDPQPAELVSRLADLYGVPGESVLVTRGSDEGIDLLTRVFCRAGQDAILQCPPTFGMYKIAAQTQGAGIISVPRSGASFALDKPALLDAVQQGRRLKVVFLTSPNNPTGDLVGKEFLQQLLEVAQNRAIVVVDEAYAEFCHESSAAGMVDDHENLVVLRTMSKAFAAAGLRCGAVIAQPAVIALLRRVIAPYPLPSPVVALALRMLDNEVLAKQQRLMSEIGTNKELLLRQLEGRKFIRNIIPGEANFVLIRVDNADGLLTHCAELGVIIRGFPADPSLQEYIRISVGSQSDIAALGTVFDKWERAI